MLVGWLTVGMTVAMAQSGSVTSWESSGGAAAAPDYYVIQSGDTLSDIASRFLGDAYVWPELWSVNDHITNPHWIYPGNRIHFRLGDASNPPSAEVDHTGYRGGAPTGDYASVVRAQEPAAAACGLPPVFDRAYQGLKLSAPGVLGDNDALDIIGDVYGSDVPGSMIGEGAVVYLRVADPDSVECGSRLSVYRRQGRKLRGAGGSRHVYRVLGVAEVLRVDDDIVTAVLRDSYTEIERGDLVGAPIQVELQVNVLAPVAAHDTRATIIARLTEEQRLASTGETVFLDRGTDAGVDVGTSLFLVERRDGLHPDGKEDDRLPERVVGRVVVVRAEASVATGVVVDAARDIQVGLRAVSSPNAE